MTIRHIFISDDHNFYGRHGKGALDHPMREVVEAQCVAGKGIVGDRFYDYKPDYKGQITLFSWEVYESIQSEFDIANLDPSAFRRNVLVEGADLNTLIGKHFDLQGIELLGTEEAKPCYWMNGAIAEGAEEAMKGRGGLRAKILSTGTLRAESAPASKSA